MLACATALPLMSAGSSEHGMLLLLLAGAVDYQSSVWGAESQ